MNIINFSVVQNRNRQIAIIGSLCALIILMGIPGLHLGYIQLNPTVSLTIMHIPVILAAILAGLPGGLITGLIFGITSLANSASNPSGVLDPFFVNPLCSVLPRLLFGAFSCIIFNLISFIPKLSKIISSGVSAFVSTIFHSFCVIGSLYLFSGASVKEAMGGTEFIALMIAILPNGCLEALAAVIVCVAVTTAIFVGTNKKPKLFIEKDEEIEENQEDKENKKVEEYKEDGEKY